MMQTEQMIKKTVKCPICGTWNEALIPLREGVTSTPVWCDDGAGGCGKFFVVKGSMTFDYVIIKEEAA